MQRAAFFAFDWSMGWRAVMQRGFTMKIAAKVGLILAFMPALAGAAGSIYKCADAKGGVVFSDKQCGTNARVVDVRISDSPAEPAKAPPAAAPQPPVVAPPEPAPPAPVVVQSPPDSAAYRCFTPDGAVFYLHRHCPKSIAVTHYGQMGRFQTATQGYAPVDEVGVSETEACGAIYSNDAQKRSGSEHDDRYSTFERNAGNDPCKS
jgi:hypothetical protein